MSDTDDAKGRCMTWFDDDDFAAILARKLSLADLRKLESLHKEEVKAARVRFCEMVLGQRTRREAFEMLQNEVARFQETSNA